MPTADVLAGFAATPPLYGCARAAIYLDFAIFNAYLRNFLKI
jgi:hypothetical protein